MNNNPIAEFSELIARASRASFTLEQQPVAQLPTEHRRALVALIDFIREYDSVLLRNLND